MATTVKTTPAAKDPNPTDRLEGGEGLLSPLVDGAHTAEEEGGDAEGDGPDATDSKVRLELPFAEAAAPSEEEVLLGPYESHPIAATWTAVATDSVNKPGTFMSQNKYRNSSSMVTNDDDDDGPETDDDDDDEVSTNVDSGRSVHGCKASWYSCALVRTASRWSSRNKQALSGPKPDKNPLSSSPSANQNSSSQHVGWDTNST